MPRIDKDIYVKIFNRDTTSHEERRKCIFELDDWLKAGGAPPRLLLAHRHLEAFADDEAALDAALRVNVAASKTRDPLDQGD